MKKYLLIISLLIFFGTLISEEISVDKNKTLLELSLEHEVPVKKIIEYLELPQNVNLQKTLTELKVQSIDFQNCIKRFEEEKVSYSYGIVVIGMLVVFFSLIITGFLIAQIEHIGKWEKRDDKIEKEKKEELTTVHTEYAKVTGKISEVSTNAIVAAITALHLHRMEVEETNKMMLTMKRNRISLWKSYAKLNVPNRSFHLEKRS